MTRFISLCSIIILYGYSLSAQQLQLIPEEIYFQNKSDRLENVYFINSGDEPLVIDTITYNLDYYFIRFDKQWSYPQIILPGDTVKMDCIIGEYAVITSSDTLDTMVVRGSGSVLIGQIKIRIGYFDNQYLEGTINGQVTDSAGPISNARVYFLYQGNYIIRTALTDINGMYSADLPEGLYLAAVQKDSYYVSFYRDQFDPYGAERVLLSSGSPLTMNFTLSRMINTGISVSGTAKDKLSNSLLRRGTIVARRRGRHTPNKISESNNTPHDIYVSFINYNGSYRINNILNPGYYYMQSFSDYYIPGYYDQTGNYPTFWEEADSVFIGGNVQDINFYLQRDSSVGSGVISGAVVNAPGDDTLTDITIFAQSLDRNSVFTYSFGLADTAYMITGLPYGRYKVIGEKLGFTQAATEEVQITPDKPVQTGIDIIFRLASSDKKIMLPDKIFLYQNFPNPFNPTTRIRFYLPEAMNVKLILSNILGEQTALLSEGLFRKGEHELTFDGSRYASGIYLLQLITRELTLSKKILLLK